MIDHLATELGLAVAERTARSDRASLLLTGALAAGRGTFRHPYAASSLTEALTHLALDAPPALADSVTAFALARRPGMVRYRELRALAAVRAGSCDVAATEFIAMLQFGVQREDGPALVHQCWMEKTNGPKTGRPGVVEPGVRRQGGSH